MSMVGEGHVEAEYQSGKFIPISYEKIDETKKDNLYADIFHRGIK